MSYATSLLAAYPSSYGPSTLLSDDLVTRSSFDNHYQPSLPYLSSGRLLSDDLAFNQITHDPTTAYRPPAYAFANSTSVFSPTNYQNPSVNNWHNTMPPQHDSFASLNDVTEYSDSLATASNTNTASSVARSINDNHLNGSMDMFSNYQQNYNRLINDADSSPQLETIWSPPQTKKKGQLNEEKSPPKYRSVPPASRTKPATVIQKKSSADELNNDITPVPSPQPPVTLTKHHNHLPRNATITESDKHAAPVDIHAWLSDSKKDLPADVKSAEEVWSVKIGQLHMAQAQHEKEKAKSSRALPSVPKKVDQKPVVNKTKTTAETKSHNNGLDTQHDTYFDSLFDGDFFRKTSTNNHTMSSSFHQTGPARNKPTTNSFNNPSTTISSKNPKYVPQRKTPRYEPPSTKRAPPTITTTSWRKHWPKEYHFDTNYPYYLHNEFTHRDLAHKDTDERFREALHKLRADRAQQQNKDINETTAKRLHYGDYVRHSTKDALLTNAVKPSPWSDFMHLKKGNLYSLSKEEKKQLYNQSKSYGERIRYRNFAIRYGDETARSHRHSVPLIDDYQESQSGNVTPRRTMNDGGSKSVSRTSKRPDSGSTNKTHSKHAGIGGSNRMISNQYNRTTPHTDRSHTNRPSDDEDGNHSDYDRNYKYKQQMKKKNVRYAKHDSSGRTTSGTEESENEMDNHSQRNLRQRNRDNNDEDLFTVREEKTLESLEGLRYKKR